MDMITEIVIITLLFIAAVIFKIFGNNRIACRIARRKEEIAIIENEQLKMDNCSLKSSYENLNTENHSLSAKYNRIRSETDVLRSRLKDLEANCAELTQQVNIGLPEEVQNAIKIRVEMMNALLACQITANSKLKRNYDDWANDLITDKEDFMNSNRLAFMASHPDFIKYFESQGLTTDEINYVCLYAIGLNGKEVGMYMDKKGHFNTSSLIRKKLGLNKHQTNIGIYIKRLLRDL